jgi:integrase/recombinase XerD
MLEAYPESNYMSMRNKAIMDMLFDTGIRNYELCMLPESNIKYKHIVIFGKDIFKVRVGS